LPESRRQFPVLLILSRGLDQQLVRRFGKRTGYVLELAASSVEVVEPVRAVILEAVALDLCGNRPFSISGFDDSFIQADDVTDIADAEMGDGRDSAIDLFSLVRC
jgi:hypothetical protein